MPSIPEPSRPRATGLFRLSAACGLLWLMVVLPMRFAQNPVPYDFTQYVMGGVIAVEGEWDALYPIPDPTSNRNAGYQIGSTSDPRYVAAAAQHGIPDGYRFTQAPIIALFYAPLALLDFRTAYFVWIGLLILAVWGTALTAAEVRRRCGGGRRHLVDAVLVLGICMSPLAFATIRTANVSSILALCTGVILLACRPERVVASSTAMVVGGLFKYATGILALPLALLGCVRSLFWSSAAAASLLLASLPITGTTPWRTFFVDILPTMAKTPYERSNQSITGLLATFAPDGVPAEWLSWQRMIGFTLLAALVVWLGRRRRALAASMPHRAAAFALLTAWWVVAGPLFWTHYWFYFVPFWGWLAHEMRAPGWRRYAAGGAIALTCCPWLVALDLAFPLNLYMFWSTPLWVAVAIARLRSEVGVDEIGPGAEDGGPPNRAAGSDGAGRDRGSRILSEVAAPVPPLGS
jgi:hypothetical protein